MNGLKLILEVEKQRRFVWMEAAAAEQKLQSELGVIAAFPRTCEASADLIWNINAGHKVQAVTQPVNTFLVPFAPVHRLLVP